VARSAANLVAALGARCCLAILVYLPLDCLLVALCTGLVCTGWMGSIQECIMAEKVIKAPGTAG
jgi:hypothetical protein